MTGLFLSRGITGPSIALVAIAVAAFGSGLEPRALLRRGAPVMLAAAGTGVFNGLVAGDAAAGAAVALRLAAIALAGIVALATIEPTELADGLVQHLRAPSRFAVGTLAAMRLLPLFVQEWETRGLARRARGFESDRGLLAPLVAFPGRTHGLFIAAVRRAVALGLAMDARGFGTRPCRTLSRPRPLRRADAALLLVALVLAAIVIGAPA